MLVVVKFLTWAASPLGFLIFCVIIGLIVRYVFRRRMPSQILIGLGLIQLIIFSSPLVAEGLLGRLETEARKLATQTQGPQQILDGRKYRAILLLGGATLPASPPDRPHPDLLGSADRIWHAARLFHNGVAPQIILSGGKRPGLEGRQVQSEAEGMAQLLRDLGVPQTAMILEDQSRTTRENAERVRSIVGEGAVAVVTSAFHTPRAISALRAAEINATAFPTDFRVVPQVEPLWIRLLPSAGALQDSETALKEYLALLIRY